jgi:NADP-dependent 3-hydroxy acid dehydrogenase YdfG
MQLWPYRARRVPYVKITQGHTKRHAYGIIMCMKHVLITGGTDGIGKVTAQKLQEAGFRVTILGRNAEKTQAVAAELNCMFVVADVVDCEEAGAVIGRAEEANGPVDILINNAGVWLSGPLETMKMEDIKRTVDVNTLGTIYYAQAVLPGMKKRGGGRIINVNSQAGLYASAGRTVYNASKWAVTGFTKALQEEVRGDGIAVTGFYPGTMNTQFFAKADDAKDRSSALDPAVAAAALVYICQTPEHVEIPEFGIKSLEY